MNRRSVGTPPETVTAFITSYPDEYALYENFPSAYSASASYEYKPPA